MTYGDRSQPQVVNPTFIRCTMGAAVGRNLTVQVFIENLPSNVGTDPISFDRTSPALWLLWLLVLLLSLECGSLAEFIGNPFRKGVPGECLGVS